MKSLIQPEKYFMSPCSKILIALTVTSVISVLFLSSALADRDNGHGRRGYQQNNHGSNQGRRGDHDGNRYRSGYRQPTGRGYGNRQYYESNYRNRQPYYNYAQPVYVPPPVYYEPRQSPGISLFFPLNLHQW
jgi:hypothetical protein